MENIDFVLLLLQLCRIRSRSLSDSSNVEGFVAILIGMYLMRTQKLTAFKYMLCQYYVLKWKISALLCCYYNFAGSDLRLFLILRMRKDLLQFSSIRIWCARNSWQRLSTCCVSITFRNGKYWLCSAVATTLQDLISVTFQFFECGWICCDSYQYVFNAHATAGSVQVHAASVLRFKMKNIGFVLLLLQLCRIRSWSLSDSSNAEGFVAILIDAYSMHTQQLAAFEYMLCQFYVSKRNISALLC